MDERDSPMKGMHSMIHKRSYCAPNGWDEVIPGPEFDTVTAEGLITFRLW
jgi:hypothetical protein